MVDSPDFGPVAIICIGATMVRSVLWQNLGSNQANLDRYVHEAVYSAVEHRARHFLFHISSPDAKVTF